MKRIIISESERKNILLNHNLLFEGATEDQAIMKKFKDEFMSKSDSEIADGLESMKTYPGATKEQKDKLDMAIKNLRNGTFVSMTKASLNNEFDKYIKEDTELAKSILCSYVEKKGGDEEMKSFCVSGPKEQEIMKRIESELKKGAEMVKKSDEPKKFEIKINNQKSSQSIENPYGTSTDVYAPGSIANPYGS